VVLEAAHVELLDVGLEFLVVIWMHAAEPVAGEVEVNVEPFHDFLVHGQLHDLGFVLRAVGAGLGSPTGLGLAQQLVSAREDFASKHLVGHVGDEDGTVIEAEGQGDGRAESARYAEHAREVVGVG